MSDRDRAPFPPFDQESAWKEVLGAEAARNTRDPDRVAGAYSLDSEWRNRNTFLQGHEAIRDFLAQKSSQELDYALRKDLWAGRIVQPGIFNEPTSESQHVTGVNIGSDDRCKDAR